MVLAVTDKFVACNYEDLHRRHVFSCLLRNNIEYCGVFAEKKLWKQRNSRC
jgi:hypothetical protein